jgi:hypothetical protein
MIEDMFGAKEFINANTHQRETMLIDMLRVADMEIKSLKDQLLFARRELDANKQLIHALGPAAFSGKH